MSFFGELHDLIDYDAGTGTMVWKRDRGYGRVPGTPVATGRRVTIGGKHYVPGRLAWFYVHGYWPGPHFHYVDKDRTNIALANLVDGKRKPREAGQQGDTAVRVVREGCGHRVTSHTKGQRPVDLGYHEEYDTVSDIIKMVLGHVSD